MGRAPATFGEDKEDLKRGAWTAEEDEKLVSFIHRNKGHGSWRTLPKLAGLQRCGKSCRLRWTNYLRPNIKRGNFSVEEERIIFHAHAFMGNKWSNIASHLPGRTDNEVKNHWNTHLKKRLTKMGIDPTTHLPLQYLMCHQQDAANYYSRLNNYYQSSFQHADDWTLALLRRSLQMDPTVGSHLLQWELARLESETRMQIAARSEDHIRKYASWLQSLQQGQFATGYNLNDFMHAMNLQLSSVALSTSELPLQSSKYCCKNNDDSLLKEPSACGDEEIQPLASSILYNHNSSASEGVVPHASEGPVYTSACSMATPETCSSESTSQILCDQLQLPELLSSPELMPPSLDGPNSLHDSYWNKMLNLLGTQVTLDV